MSRARVRLIMSLIASAAIPCTMSAQVPSELNGRVTDAEAGRAISGARIEVAGGAERTLSEMNGSFALRGLIPRTLTLRVRAVGYAPIDTEVTVQNGRATDVEVTLRRVVPVLDTVLVRPTRDTASVRSFDRHAIEASGRRDIGELLGTVPGVVVTQSGGPGSPSHVSIRGSGSNEVLVLVDGNAINSVITGEADVSTIGLDRVERVTVLPGAQSARYGSRALAGVVLVETRPAQREVSGRASTGSWGERSGSVTVGRAFASDMVQSGGSITGDYRDIRGDFPFQEDAVRGGGIGRRVNGDAQSAGMLASAFLEGAPGSLQMRSEWQTESRGTSGSIVQQSLSGREHDARFSGSMNGRLALGAVSWSSAIDGTRERAAFRDPSPPFGQAYDETVNANSVFASTSLSTGPETGSLSVGADARRISVASTELVADAPASQHQIGSWISAHSAHSLGNGTDITTDLTSRVDWDSFIDGAILSPRGELALSRGHGSASVSFGAGYAPPSLADQFFHEGVLVKPNPNLLPERVRNDIEVRGAMRDLRAAFVDASGEIAVFRSNIDNMIIWQPDFRFIWSPSNFDVRRSGWEGSGRIGVKSLAMEVRGSFSQSDVSYTGPVFSGQVAYRPRTTANISAGVVRLGIDAELNNRYIGARRTAAGSELNLLAPYWLSDIKLSRPIMSGQWPLDATVSVENLFDRSAAMLVDYPFPGRTWTVALRIRRSNGGALDNTGVRH